MRRPAHTHRHLLSPKGSMQSRAEPSPERWENPLSSWAEDVRVMVTGFESMIEQDPTVPWTSWDTFFSVRYAGSPPSDDREAERGEETDAERQRETERSPLKEYFSRHTMSEF
eukprot:COSAG03_NODE_9674_length_701_cov_1.061462_1_plen_112_part_10